MSKNPSRSGRKARHAQRSAPPPNPAPPGQRGGQYAPLSEAEIKAIYDTALRLLAELGLGEDHDGIIELDQALAAGADLREALDLDDRIIDLDLTPNRGDCLSLRGLAREVGVLNNVPVTEQTITATAAKLRKRIKSSWIGI